MKEMGKKEVESLSRLCQFILLFRVDLLELEDKNFACRRENAADSHLSSEDLVSKYVQDHTSYLSLILHNHNLRPENFTLETA